jgi:hypothetical protein
MNEHFQSALFVPHCIVHTLFQFDYIRRSGICICIGITDNSLTLCKERLLNTTLPIFSLVSYSHSHCQASELLDSFSIEHTGVTGASAFANKYIAMLQVFVLR